jgi:murein DD-endopeptidase MepM/ murein hydrolase activator NlpD
VKIPFVIAGFLLMLVGQQNCSGFDVAHRIPFENASSSLQPVEAMNPIRSHPASQLLNFQDPLILKLELMGVEGATIQWMHKRISSTDFLPVPGAIFAELIRERIQYDEQGEYKAVITHMGETFESNSASIMIRGQFNSCAVADLAKFRWPIAGVVGTDWIVTNYADHDPAAFSVRDFRSNTGTNAIAYDSHLGIDIALPTLKYQDRGVNVVSVTDGVVEVVTDGHFDRNTTFTKGLSANAVVVRAPNGFAIGYYHLRRDSILVKVGQSIKAGTVIAQVGSSGYSDGPHLHLEVVDCLGKHLDPAQANLFASLPAYSQPMKFMDFHAQPTVIESIQHAKSTTGQSYGGSNVNQTIYFAYTLSSVPSGAAFKAVFYRPDGVKSFEINLGQASGRRVFPLYYVWGNFKLTTAGTWKIYLKSSATPEVESSFQPVLQNQQEFREFEVVR